MARLVLIETTGNQDFIFATNKLKQNVGASELIHRIGTRFVLAAVAEEVPTYRPLAARMTAAKPMAAAEYARQLVEIAGSNPIGTASVEVLVATSGKAVLLVDELDTGRRIIERVTLQALRSAPGAVVRGIVDDEFAFDCSDSRAAHLRMRATHERINALWRDLPAPEARFPTLPIVAQCATSGLPAEGRGPDGEYLSWAASRKREESDAGWERVEASLGARPFAKHVERLEDLGVSWLAVVHADGNGFGKVFLNLAGYMPETAGTSARSYCDFYRNLSLALDLAGVEALRAALGMLTPRKWKAGRGRPELLPIVPLVFGGDDLTVICDGAQAITFAETYLRAFEDATEKLDIDGFKSVIPDLVDPQTRQEQKFGGAAGIAVVKPHHPFHRAYRLAADLTASAKKTKTLLRTTAISALDFQVVYQDAAGNLARLRSDWRVDEFAHEDEIDRQDLTEEVRGMPEQEEWLHGRPYVVSGGNRAGHARSGRDWMTRHEISALKRAVAALVREDSGLGERPEALPRSQQHALRTALFEGKDVADARLGLIRDRYDVPWEAFGDAKQSLFLRDSVQAGETEIFRTRFIDALEIVDLNEKMAQEARTAATKAAAPAGAAGTGAPAGGRP